MEEINFDIIEYIGKLDDGIFVLMTLAYQEQFYETIFYYKEAVVALTPDSKLEKKLGCQIEDWSGYSRLMLRIIEKIVPYDEMINIVNDFDPKIYKIQVVNK
jgi:hypothetical protein